MKILTFDLEDWFHILDNPSTEKPDQWEKFESRIENNVERILGLLNENNQRATWFCLGWVARKYPGLVKKIATKHDIACHSDVHQLVYKQSKKEFREDTLSVIKTLEDLTGKKMNVYRASGFSITPETKWAFEILAECGITTDCSLFPARRNHGGFPGYKIDQPCRILVNGQTIKEFPLNIFRFGNLNIAFSGGGYFRALPYPMIKRMTEKSDYIMSYFHPRDFDPNQPVLENLPWKRKIMSYSGLKNSEGKLRKWLNDFSFTDLAAAERLIDWEKTRIVELLYV